MKSASEDDWDGFKLTIYLRMGLAYCRVFPKIPQSGQAKVEERILLLVSTCIGFPRTLSSCEPKRQNKMGLELRKKHFYIFLSQKRNKKCDSLKVK